ncbi:MAG: hypothetical protein WC890_00965 [Candidatus Margulisiibacteriota bacterium]
MYKKNFKNNTFEYNYRSFERLLVEVASNDYIFCRFDLPLKNKRNKIIYLRHDVDISPLSALKLGQIENNNGIKANFFFQIGADTYNIFSPKNIATIIELRKLGHCVGLHIDEQLLSEDEEKIMKTLNWFNDCIVDIDFVVSFHRPTNRVLGKKFTGFVNSYQAEYFSKDCYVSDSRRNKEFYPKLLNLLKNREPSIQLLLHPCWWYPENNIRKFKKILIKRRISEVNCYIKNNFTKAFRGTFQNENSNFGL